MIKHAGTYSTVYAHLSRFGAHARTGARVHQGDTIGYVGKPVGRRGRICITNSASAASAQSARPCAADGDADRCRKRAPFRGRDRAALTRARRRAGGSGLADRRGRIRNRS